ncbi:PAS domain S-box protein [Alcanivorax sp. JB21]|uniref:PAS domain S-box protein n=1 Tax=Alcanivorax limicola TaxID=2874102 RepID=UPI001CBC3C13|nr:PAS domain S-box protein [Alcanivorax limicola]MBZ2190557.1 PAS domain S-box protein [Alcanivorax limicola]
MSASATETGIDTRLRDMAETRLKTGTAIAAGNYSLGLDALNLLHRLSSDPLTSGDALKLLHELQVHQVEIDLQNEVIQNDANARSDELMLYKALYQSAPIGYLLVDFEGKIFKINQAGAEMFSVAPDSLRGSQMDRLLTADSQSVLAGMLERLRQGISGQAGEVFAADADNNSRLLRIMANLSPDKHCVLLVCFQVP